MPALEVALQTRSGAYYPIRRNAPLPGLIAGDYPEPNAQYGVTVHRSPYGSAWVERKAGRVTSCAGTLAIHVSGVTPEACGEHADAWQRVIESTSRLYVGARYLAVAGVLQRPKSTQGRGLTYRLISTELEFVDDLWRLSPDDQRPRRFPVESDPGLYPLGMMRVTDEFDGLYEVEYLGGVTGQTLTSTLPVTGLSLHPLELTYDESL